MSYLNEQLILDSLNRTLTLAVNAAVDKAVAEAVKRVEADVRQQVGAIATSLLFEYEIHRRQDRLVIEVKISDRK